MDELDIEKIEEFGFSTEQCNELLKNYQKSILDDCSALKALWQEQDIEQLILKLHAFKGMIGLFAKAEMVDFVVQLERDLRGFKPKALDLLAEQFQILYAKTQNLQIEVNAYLDLPARALKRAPPRSREESRG